MNRILVIVTFALLSSACQSGPDRSPGSTGTAGVPVGTTSAQTVGQDQGTAQASETVSSTNTVTPTVFNLMGAKTIKIRQVVDGETEVTMEGHDEAVVEINSANMGVRFGNEGQKSSASSGGGAAGGTGSAARDTSQPPGNEP